MSNGTLLDILPPEECWRSWIANIARDPQMSSDRAVQHLISHITKHRPDKNDKIGRWEEWLGGAYNLLAIVAAIHGLDPSYKIGVNLLFRKWEYSKTDHTPPPPREPSGGGS